MASDTLQTPYSIQLKKQYRDTLQLIISGELDETNADIAFASLESEITEQPEYKHIACDFGQLAYANSKTLGYLTDFIARTHRLGKTISFDRVHPKTQYIFDMIGLSKVVDKKIAS
jgi:anti-anti-sigma factor